MAFEAFWERVDKSAGADACWPWTGSHNPNGYGLVSDGRGSKLAHRVAMQLTNGDPGTKCVLHRCDNPPCCNPAHLFVGTQQENIADMHAKGRYRNGLKHHPERAARGERAGKAKLTEQQVTEIRQLLAAGQTLQRDIAARFGVNRSCVSRIASGEAWGAQAGAPRLPSVRCRYEPIEAALDTRDGKAMLRLVVPVRTVSEANAHSHWRNRQRRAKRQREAVELVLRQLPAFARGKVAELVAAGGAKVELTRVAPRGLDSDNLAGSTKHVRDQLAQWLGIDDRDPRVTWSVLQAKGAPNTYGVHVMVWA